MSKLQEVTKDQNIYKVKSHSVTSVPAERGMLTPACIRIPAQRGR